MLLTHQLTAVAVGLGSAALAFLILRFALRTDRRVLHRIRELESRTPDAQSPNRRNDRRSLFQRLFSPRREATLDELQGRLVQAGFDGRLAVPTFALLQCLGGLTFGGLAILLMRRFSPGTDVLLPALIGACSGFLCPSELLRRLTLRRQRMFERAIPDVLDLLVACLDAGLSLEGAMQRITTEIQAAHPVLGSEMQRVQRDIDLGSPPDRALQGFADRANLDVVRSLATACSQARRYGSKLTQTLRTLAESLRQQREQRAEEAAQAAAVKILLPTLVLLFPIIFVVLAGPAALQISEEFAQAGMNHDR